MTSIDSLFDGSDAHLLCDDSAQYLAGFDAGKRVMARLAGLHAPELYACTKCGGANYGCKCESLKDCTKPLYYDPLVQQGEPVAWLTYTENGLPMLWTDLPEATLYCDDDETPTPLYTAQPTCFSAGDMADAQAKAFREGQQSCESA